MIAFCLINTKRAILHLWNCCSCKLFRGRKLFSESIPQQPPELTAPSSNVTCNDSFGLHDMVSALDVRTRSKHCYTPSKKKLSPLFSLIEQGHREGKRQMFSLFIKLKVYLAVNGRGWQRRLFVQFTVTTVLVPCERRNVSPHHQPIWLLDSYYPQNNEKNSPTSWLVFSGDILLLVWSASCYLYSLFQVTRQILSHNIEGLS